MNLCYPHPQTFICPALRPQDLQHERFIARHDMTQDVLPWHCRTQSRQFDTQTECPSDESVDNTNVTINFIYHPTRPYLLN